MKIFKKTLLILLTVFLFKLMNSCCIIFGGCCKDDPLPTTFNNLKISNLDNSREYETITTSNEMKRAAVAFNIKVVDTNYYFNYYSHFKKYSLGFSNAYAMECDNPFAVTSRINCISITTKYDINSSIKAGEEVVNYFVAKTHFGSMSGLYSTIEYVLDNQENILYEPSLDIRFFLKIPVENNIAQFNFQISLSDGTFISDSTNLISIVD